MYSKLGRKLSLRGSPSGVTAADLQDLLLAKLGLAVGFSPRSGRTSRNNHVAHVLGVRAKRQMLRVHARRSMAHVAGLYRGREIEHPSGVTVR